MHARTVNLVSLAALLVFMCFPLTSSAQDWNWEWSELDLGFSDSDTLLLPSARPFRVDGEDGIRFVVRSGDEYRIIRDVDPSGSCEWECDDSSLAFLDTLDVLTWNVTSKDSTIYLAVLSEQSESQALLRTFQYDPFARRPVWTQKLGYSHTVNLDSFQSNNGWFICLAEINGDDQPDYLVIGRRQAEMLRLVHNDDICAWQSLPHQVINPGSIDGFGTTHPTVFVNTGDVDGDGVDELVVISTTSEHSEYGTGSGSSLRDMKIVDDLNQQEVSTREGYGRFYRMGNFGFLQQNDSPQEEMVAYDGEAWTTWTISENQNDYYFDPVEMISSPGEVLAVWYHQRTGLLEGFLTRTYFNNTAYDDHDFSGYNRYYNALSFWKNTDDDNAAEFQTGINRSFFRGEAFFLQPMVVDYQNSDVLAVNLYKYISEGYSLTNMIGGLYCASEYPNSTWQILDHCSINTTPEGGESVWAETYGDILLRDGLEKVKLQNGVLSLNVLDDGTWNTRSTMDCASANYLYVGNFDGDAHKDIYLQGADNIWRDCEPWNEQYPTWEADASAFGNVSPQPDWENLQTVIDYQGDGDSDFLFKDGSILVNNNILASPEGQPETEQPSDFLLVSAYPNPFNATLNVRFEAPVPDITIRLYDILGREALAPFEVRTGGTTGTLTLPTSNLASGIYFLSLEAGGQHVVERVVLLK